LRSKTEMIQLLSYIYPNTIKLRIEERVYTYSSSEFFCRKMMKKMRHPSFRVINWWKKVSRLEEKEVI